MSAVAAPDLALAVACAAALLLPGLALLRLAGDPSSGAERVAMAVGVSLCAAPLALLATSLFGIGWTHGRVLGALLILALIALAGRRPRWPRRPDAAGATALAIVAIGFAVRAYQARALVVPLWVDGYHHTLITELILRAGRLPTGFRPFIDVDGFYYHFGFHALAAEVAWLAGASAPRAVLWVGQAINGATTITLWLLALRLTGSRWAAAAAAAVPAGLFHFPAYFLTWGRYTQLTALAALPVAVCLLATVGARDARRTARSVALAAAVSAGLVLIHYRVAVVYALCAVVIGVGALRGPERALRVGRLAAVVALAALMAAPWLLGPLRAGAAHLVEATASVDAERAWWSWSSEVNDVPMWLFTIRWNAACLGTAALGLVAGLVVRRREAAAVIGVLALAGLAFAPEAFGLPATWMLPRFAAAISLFVPAALGIAFLWLAAERVARPLARGARLGALLRHRARPPGVPGSPDPIGSEGAPRDEDRVRVRIVSALAAATLVGVTAAGAWSMRDIVNRVTVIASAADLPAYAWIGAHVPSDARFLVRAAPWHLGTCRGIDGGYWLPLMADRHTTMPASFYAYGKPADVEAIGALCAEVALGDALGDADIDRLMARAGADWVYVGAAQRDGPGGFGAARLRRLPNLVEAYAEGEIAVFCRAGAAGCPAR